jgi:hypothetical protein
MAAALPGSIGTTVSRAFSAAASAARPCRTAAGMPATAPMRSAVGHGAIHCIEKVTPLSTPVNRLSGVPLS